MNDERQDIPDPVAPGAEEGGTQVPGPASSPAPQPFTPEDERLWSAAAHASGIVAPIIGPIVVQMLAKGRSALVDENAREALNFQVSLVIVLFIAMLLLLVGIGICIFIPAGVAGYVNMILAAVEAYNGKAYKYPVTLRLVK